MNNLAYDTPVDGSDTSQQDIAAMQALLPIPRISIQAFCETEGVANP
ncbi:CtpF protein, partial [Mesorhizobium sp. M7A.T.Ca.TU.009.01.3.1]